MRKVWLIPWTILGIYASVCARAHALTPLTKQARSTAVGDIHIDTTNVFDPRVPGEDRWPFTWANKIHYRTRHYVIRRELLLEPGDPLDEFLLEESERNMRALGFIKNANIRTKRGAPGKTDLWVKTQDSWTTQPQINFGTEAGESHFAIGMLEQNVLGYGKTLSYFYRHNSVDGNGHDFGYTDPQLFGSHTRLDTQIVDSPTGHQQRVTIAQPFYAQEVPWAAGVNWNHNEGRQKIYKNSNIVNDYLSYTHDLDAFAGHRLNDNPLDVYRFTFRYLYSDSFFRSNASTVPGSLPKNQTFTGPAINWTRSQSRFVKEIFIDKAERVEDINLGHETGIALGATMKTLGSSANVLPFNLNDGWGWMKRDTTLGLVSYGTTGRYYLNTPTDARGNLRNTIYYVNANLYSHLTDRFPLTGVLHSESAYAQNPDQDNLIVLDGRSGLRGYKANAFTGNKSLLFNAEARAFHPHEWFHLFYVGGAAFFDSGQVQPLGQAFTEHDIHSDVGVGLRVALSRASEGSVFRIDVAYALGSLPQGDRRVIVSITSGQGFQRAGNTYSRFPTAVNAN